MIADEYRRFLDVVLDETAVKLVMTWGLSDRYSWIVRHENNADQRRSNRKEERPLPFDRDLKKKPAWHALAQAFAGAPRRERGPGGNTSRPPAVSTQPRRVADVGVPALVLTESSSMTGNALCERRGHETISLPNRPDH